MRRIACICLASLIAGCQAIGAKGYLADLQELQNLPPALLDKIGICQQIDGTFAGDGVYTNTTANGVVLLEFNDACDGVSTLRSRNGGVEFVAP
jgi:hypothetical protein